MPRDQHTYGGISIVDNATATVISGIGIANKVQFLFFDTNDPSQNTTPDHTSDDITIDDTSDYLVTVSITIDSIAGAAATYGLFCYINNGATAVPNLHAHRDMPAGGGVEGSISLSGIATLTAADTIELWVVNETNTQNVILSDVTMSVVSVG